MKDIFLQVLGEMAIGPGFRDRKAVLNLNPQNGIAK
jgi:hypothetical protein